MSTINSIFTLSYFFLLPQLPHLVFVLVSLTNIKIMHSLTLIIAMGTEMHRNSYVGCHIPVYDKARAALAGGLPAPLLRGPE